MSGTTLFTVVLDQSRLRTESLVMRLRRMATVALAGLLVVVISQSMPVEAGLFVQPTASELSGTSPSGLLWTAVATGTALPVRSSATSAFNGAPGAVVYVNTATGLMQFDPKGLDVSALVITNTTGTVFTISSNTFPAVVGSSGLPPTDLPPLNVATFRERISGGSNQGRARDATRKEVHCGADHGEASHGLRPCCRTGSMSRPADHGRRGRPSRHRSQ